MELLIGLLMLPIVVGFFFATVFLPMALVFGGVVCALVSIWRLALEIAGGWEPLGVFNRRVLIEVDELRIPPLVNLGARYPQFIHCARDRHVHEREVVLGRDEIGQMLVQAQRLLAGQYQIQLLRCYDDLPSHSPQADNGLDWTNGYNTGGSIDVSLVDAEGGFVDLGPIRNAPEGGNLTIDDIDSTLVPIGVRENRRALAAALLGVGFVNHPHQWWHWSFGNEFWAETTGLSPVLFTAVHLATYLSQQGV
jgi:hypothetical protein